MIYVLIIISICAIILLFINWNFIFRRRVRKYRERIYSMTGFETSNITYTLFVKYIAGYPDIFNCNTFCFDIINDSILLYEFDPDFNNIPKVVLLEKNNIKGFKLVNRKQLKEDVRIKQLLELENYDIDLPASVNVDNKYFVIDYQFNSHLITIVFLLNINGKYANFKKDYSEVKNHLDEILYK